MAKVHLIPRGSVFENQLRKICDPGDEVVNYDRTIRGYFSLFQKIRRSDAMFVFILYLIGSFGFLDFL